MEYDNRNHQARHQKQHEDSDNPLEMLPRVRSLFREDAGIFAIGRTFEERVCPFVVPSDQAHNEPANERDSEPKADEASAVCVVAI